MLGALQTKRAEQVVGHPPGPDHHREGPPTMASSRLRHLHVPSKPDIRATFRAAYAMARRMMKHRPGRSTGEALTWFLDAGFRRFGYAALPIVRAAGWAVFDQLHVTKAATGTPAELARQGMLTRCVRLEPAPRGGWSWAWTHDGLAAVNLNRSHRAYRVRQR